MRAASEGGGIAAVQFQLAIEVRAFLVMLHAMLLQGYRAGVYTQCRRLLQSMLQACNPCLLSSNGLHVVLLETVNHDIRRDKLPRQALISRHGTHVMEASHISTWHSRHGSDRSLQAALPGTLSHQRLLAPSCSGHPTTPSHSEMDCTRLVGKTDATFFYRAGNGRKFMCKTEVERITLSMSP